MPKISILISVYGQLSMTRRCLDAIRDSLSGKFDYEVLLIDDASLDNSAEFLRSLAKPHRCYFNQNNSGFSINNNRLAREAKGEYLLFLNNDAFVKGDWLTPMLEVFQKHENVGMVGNVQKLAGSFRYDHMGVVFGPGGNPRHFGQGYFHHPFKGRIRRWSAVTAACAMVRRDSFMEVGGFDEDFINGCEDVELCIRMASFGLNHYVAHDSVIEHVKGASRGRKKYNRQNFEILMRKCGRTIRNNQAVYDQKLHAKTYLLKLLIKPQSVNFTKLMESALIYLNLKKLPPPTSRHSLPSWEILQKRG